MAVFPFPQLAELREKYTYNITPFPTSVKSSPGFVRLFLFFSEPQWPAGGIRQQCRDKAVVVVSVGVGAAGTVTTTWTWTMKTLQ